MSCFARAENARISPATLCRVLLTIIAAASLAACAQSPVGRQKADLGTNRQAAVQRPHRVAALHPRPISRVRVPDRDAKQTASHGVASFYSDTETASGERFDKNELTAAHPSLPFGTKLRVTHGGSSVIVTINDRGPFIRGRVLDLSTGAARAIGLTGAGVGRVTAEVVS